MNEELTIASVREQKQIAEIAILQAIYVFQKTTALHVDSIGLIYSRQIGTANPMEVINATMDVRFP